MTKEQKEKVQEVAAIDAKGLMDTLHWFANKSSVRGLLNITLPTECPSPIIIEDKESWYLTDIEGFEFTGFTYYGRREKETSPYLKSHRKKYMNLQPPCAKQQCGASSLIRYTCLQLT